uniref:Uncharacterized protein n=2 Tax=Chloropicon primus TaxID=1764295 RepID=A0A7S2T2X2_9CHLO
MDQEMNGSAACLLWNVRIWNFDLASFLAPPPRIMNVSHRIFYRAEQEEPSDDTSHNPFQVREGGRRGLRSRRRDPGEGLAFSAGCSCEEAARDFSSCEGVWVHPPA